VCVHVPCEGTNEPATTPSSQSQLVYVPPSQLWSQLVPPSAAVQPHAYGGGGGGGGQLSSHKSQLPFEPASQSPSQLVPPSAAVHPWGGGGGGGEAVGQLSSHWSQLVPSSQSQPPVHCTRHVPPSQTGELEPSRSHWLFVVGGVVR
jgi:hypothetical protein